MVRIVSFGHHFFQVVFAVGGVNHMNHLFGFFLVGFGSSPSLPFSSWKAEIHLCFRPFYFGGGQFYPIHSILFCEEPPHHPKEREVSSKSHEPTFFQGVKKPWRFLLATFFQWASKNPKHPVNTPVRFPRKPNLLQNLQWRSGPWHHLEKCDRCSFNSTPSPQRKGILFHSHHFSGATPPKINIEPGNDEPWKMFFLLQGCILRFHVGLPGCMFNFQGVLGIYGILTPLSFFWD